MAAASVLHASTICPILEPCQPQPGDAPCACQPLYRDSPVWTACLPPPLSALQAQWLALPGSLTRALRALGQFQLTVLYEGSAQAADDEALALGIPGHTPCWLREVLMSVNGTPAVLGRSLTPDRPGAHAWQDIRTLSNTPLGVLLYEDPRIARTAFEYSAPQAGHPLAALAAQACPRPPADSADPPALWARRSVFHLQQEPLLVAECFLPGLWPLAWPPVR